jgi:hypothetical protein
VLWAMLQRIPMLRWFATFSINDKAVGFFFVLASLQMNVFVVEHTVGYCKKAKVSCPFHARHNYLIDGLSIDVFVFVNGM